MAKFKRDNLWFSQNTEILTDGKTLTISDKQQQFLDPNGIDRNIFMVSEATASGLSFWIVNVGTLGDLVVKNDVGNQELLLIKPSQIGYLTCNGTTWNCSVGSTGATGGTGAIGPEGPQGEDGLQGPAGDPGPTGGTGGEGLQGPQGEAGLAGDPGPTGGTGAQGPEGIAGDTGGTGDQGPQGQRGEGFSIDESIPDFDETDVIRIEEIPGISTEDVYIVTIFNDSRSNTSTPIGINGDMSKHIVMFDGVDWYDWGFFIGETGGTGAQGGTGATGATGNTGQVGATLTGGTGAQGNPGPEGDPGPAGTTGGTGGQGNPGPEGDPGPVGPSGGTGAQGDPGIEGDPGPTGGTGSAGSLDTNFKRGNISLSSGINSIIVNFGQSFSSNNYSIGYSLINTTDTSPSSYTSIITAKSESGFTVTLSGQIDSANYTFSWFALL